MSWPVLGAKIKAAYRLLAKGEAPYWIKDGGGAVIGMAGADGTAASGAVALATAAAAGGAAVVGAVLSTDSGAAAANTAALQSVVDRGGYVPIRAPGVYMIGTIAIPNDTVIDIFEGVILVKADDANHSTLMFRNADWVGGNRNIGLIGSGTLYCNANSYADTYAANSTDCPILPAAMNSIAAIPTPNTSLSYMNGVHFENVDRLVVGNGDGKPLRIMQPSKYHVYGAKLTHYDIDGIEVYGDDTVNPATGGTSGRDGVHVQGQTRYGRIRRIRGTTNDDVVVLNTRDIDAFTSSRSVGFIRDIAISDINAKVQRRAGAIVKIYGGRDCSTSSKDTPPAITGISQTGRVVTVTTATAHGMAVGQAFKIASSNPSGYNGDLLRVVSVPTATTFTYFAVASIGSYVGSAVLTRYYQMDGITVSGIRGTTYTGGGVEMSVTTDSGSNRGVIDAPLIRDVSVVATNPSGGGMIRSDFVTVADLDIDAPLGRNAQSFPLVELTNNGSFMAGTLRIRNVRSKIPYKPDSGSGQAPINIVGVYENALVEGLDLAVEDGGGGWSQAISAGAAGGKLTIRDSHVRPSYAGGSYTIVRADAAGDAGQIILEGLTPADKVCLAQLGSAVTSCTLALKNLILPVNTGAFLNLYGTNLRVVFDGIVVGNTPSGMAYVGLSTTTVTFLSPGNNVFGTTPLINSGSDSTGRAAAVVMGADLRVDITQVARVEGGCAWNTNTGAGTLATAGIVDCLGTSANSWKRRGNNSLTY